MNSVASRFSRALIVSSRRPAPVRFGAAALFVLAAIGATLPFTHPEQSPYFPLLLAAVCLSAAFGGFWPGVFATLTSATLGFYFLVPPHLTFAVLYPEDITRLLVFVPTGLLLSWLIGAFVSTQAKLQRSEERFRLLAASAPVGIFQTDATANWIYANPAWSAISGMAPDQTLGLEWMKAIHPLDRDRISAKWRDASSAGEPYSSEWRFQDAQGNVHWVRENATPTFSDAKFAGYVGTITDITHIVAAQDALAESESRFRQLIDALPQMVWTARPDGYVDYYNQKWYEVTGMRRDFYGDDSWESVMHPDDVQKCLGVWYSAVKSGKVYEIEYRYKTVSGTYRWHLGRAIPLRDKAENIVKWFGTCTDIDELKRAQAKVVHAEKLAAVGRLAASVAHELNNPLGAVLNFVYLARSEENVHLKNEYLARAENELSRAAQLANRTLSIYRGGTSKAEISVSGILNDVLAVFEVTAASRGVRIETKIRDNARIIASSDEFRQVLGNLISNALDAVGDGGKIMISLRTTKILSSGQTRMRLTVADNGTGIPKSLGKQIFDPFFSTKQETASGLGLWVARSIVEDHGGTIRFRSSTHPGRHGTAFSIRLATVAASQKAQRA